MNYTEETNNASNGLILNSRKRSFNSIENNIDDKNSNDIDIDIDIDLENDNNNNCNDNIDQPPKPKKRRIITNNNSDNPDNIVIDIPFDLNAIDFKEVDDVKNDNNQSNKPNILHPHPYTNHKQAPKRIVKKRMLIII